MFSCRHIKTCPLILWQEKITQLEKTDDMHCFGRWSRRIICQPGTMIMFLIRIPLMSNHFLEFCAVCKDDSLRNLQVLILACLFLETAQYAPSI